jgi:large subunit ribosomal protein L25
MEIASIKGEARQPGGRSANRRLRKQGFVPAVVYGHQQTPETIALSRHDLLLALEHGQHVVKVTIGQQKVQYLLKDVQFDHLQLEPIHADLMRVNLDERVRIKVGIELRGEPHGIHEGGELIHVLTDHNSEDVVASVRAKRGGLETAEAEAEAEAETEEAAAQPEVIGRAAKQEETEGEAGG